MASARDMSDYGLDLAVALSQVGEIDPNETRFVSHVRVSLGYAQWTFASSIPNPAAREHQDGQGLAG